MEIQDNEDLEVTTRILNVLSTIDPERKFEGLWDNGVEYILKGNFEW